MKKYLKYFFVFIFFLVLFYLSPISGDDWGNYIVGSSGLRSSLGVALGMYFDWEGRLISRVFINILTYHKWIWNILNSLLIVGLVFVSEKIIGMDKKCNVKTFVFPLSLLIIFCMNIYTFSETMVWLAGNITYFFMVPVVIWYFYYLIINDKYNKWFSFIFVLINLFGTMFVENMGMVLVVGNILLLIYKYICNKKIDKRIVVYLIISIFSMTSMLLSPGTRYRNSIENIEFNKLNIFEKVMYNLPKFVYYTFIINSYLLVLLSVSNYLIINKKIKNSKIKYSLIIYMLVIPLFTVFIYPLSELKSTFLDFFVNTNVFIIIYWLSYLVITLYLLFIENKKDLKIVLLYLIGLVSNGVMLVSPTWGFRTSLFTYIMLCIVSLYVINKYIKSIKYFVYSGYCLLGVFSLFYLVFYINIFRCQNNLEKSIKKQLNEDNKIIYIDKFPDFANCNINPGNSYHIQKYKLYYNIPDEKELVLVDGKWRFIIYNN